MCHFLVFVSGKFFVAGINLTENLRYILVHPFGSLKKMTLQSLPCLKIWIKQQYPGPKRKCINIIAGDFIGNNDFVKDVIELNTKINPPLLCQSEVEQIAFNSQLPNLWKVEKALSAFIVPCCKHPESHKGPLKLKQQCFQGLVGKGLSIPSGFWGLWTEKRAGTLLQSLRNYGIGVIFLEILWFCSSWQY